MHIQDTIKSKKTVAILLATYNGAGYLREQIDSILGQTFTDWHLYVHDDGSRDDTIAIVRNYEQKHPEQVTLLDYPPQGGACNNFFSLLESVKAPYYMFCDQDDVWLKDKIQVCFDRMRQLEASHSQAPIIVHSDLTLVDSRMKVIDTSFVRNQRIRIDRVKEFADYAYTNTVTGCTMLFNAKAVECIRYPRTKARMHDSWIAMSVAANQGIVSFIDQPLILYRQHGSNTLGARDMGKFSLLGKLRNAAVILREIAGHYREMNAIKPISLPDFVMARIKYKHD